jgi:hypothetical protein
MTLLKAMEEHGTIFLHQNVLPHFHDKVGSYPEEVPIEGGVVDLAKRESARDLRLTARVLVRENVSRIQQFLVRKPANCTALTIGADDPLSKTFLM